MNGNSTVSVGNICFVLVIVGAALYLVRAVVPMDRRVERVVIAVVIVSLCIWLLQAFGFGAVLPRWVPRVKF